MEQQLESTAAQWASVSEAQTQLEGWLIQAPQGRSTDLKGSLAEKRAQYQTNKVHLQDVQAHRKLVDSTLEKTEQLLQVTAAPSQDMVEYKDKVAKKYDALAQAAVEAVQLCELRVQNHAAYKDAAQQATDYLASGKDRLALCAAGNDDKQAVVSKLNRAKVILIIS